MLLPRNRCFQLHVQYNQFKSTAKVCYETTRPRYKQTPIHTQQHSNMRPYDKKIKTKTFLCNIAIIRVSLGCSYCLLKKILGRCGQCVECYLKTTLKKNRRETPGLSAGSGSMHCGYVFIHIVVCLFIYLVCYLHPLSLIVFFVFKKEKNKMERLKHVNTPTCMEDSGIFSFPLKIFLITPIRTNTPPICPTHFLMRLLSLLAGAFFAKQNTNT